MDDDQPATAARWAREPLDETLDGARQLTVTVADACIRGAWEALAVEAGIPSRRWRRHHPAPAGQAVIALVDGHPAMDVAAWARVASLVPGALALPTRTADELGVARNELQPPGGVLRVVDLWRARRRRARMRRRERTLAADLATFQAQLEVGLDAALAPGDDGTPFAKLPTYALASRLDVLLRSTAGWDVPAAVDLASGHATSTLMRLLVDAGRTPGQALLDAATLQSGGGAPVDRHLEELHDIAGSISARQPALLASWRDSIHGWHASRALLLESAPLRDQPRVVQALMSRGAPGADRSAPTSTTLDDAGDELRDAAQRARHLVALREQVGRDKAALYAALRALVWTLGARLQMGGSIDSMDAVFDLTVVDLLRLARGVDGPNAPTPSRAAPNTSVPADAPALPSQLRGIPASAGAATGRVIVLDDPDLDAAVDGAILVCRVTDPAWLPLMLRCAGLVAERGGPLSHAAIVARELGLPAVVGVAGVVATAATAVRADIDGTIGTVRLSADA